MRGGVSHEDNANLRCFSTVRNYVLTGEDTCRIP